MVSYIIHLNTCSLVGRNVENDYNKITRMWGRTKQIFLITDAEKINYGLVNAHTSVETTLLPCYHLYPDLLIPYKLYLIDLGTLIFNIANQYFRIITNFFKTKIDTHSYHIHVQILATESYTTEPKQIRHIDSTIDHKYFQWKCQGKGYST